VQIGKQQIEIAEAHEQVVGQELVISELQADHASAVVDFLSNKFTSVELYDDIYQLDQYAFETDKRKLQLSRTIGSARLASSRSPHRWRCSIVTFRATTCV